MGRGHKLTIMLLATAVGGCTGSGKFEARSVGTPIAAKPDLALAQAEEYFALGNVALALEAYRKVVRFAPDEVAAYNGMAACYDRMGRFDLSRRYYEQALAIAPTDPRVLHNFRLSLRLQNRNAEADALLAAATPAEEGEAVAVAAKPEPAPVALALAPPVVGSAAPVPAVPVPVVPPASAQAVASVTIELPPPTPAKVKVPHATPRAPVSAPKVVADRAGAPVFGTASVTIELPPVSKPARQARTGPVPVHLERRSLHEVALVTRAPDPVAVAARAPSRPVRTASVMVLTKDEGQPNVWQLVTRVAVEPVRRIGVNMIDTIRRSWTAGVGRFLNPSVMPSRPKPVASALIGPDADRQRLLGERLRILSRRTAATPPRSLPDAQLLDLPRSRPGRQS